jgi:hypothetical protein
MSVCRICRYLLGVTLWLAAAVPVSAATATLAWDQNPEPDVTNYNVFVSTQPGNFSSPIPVGNRTTWTFTGLQHGRQYYFAVQAQSSSGLSALSQVGYFTPAALPAGSEPTRSDFDADGKFDLLWQNSANGQLIAWHMNGAAVLSSRYLTPSAVGLEWKLRGSGDFNADGKPDLVWQNIATGEVSYYLMDGTMAFTTGMFTPDRVDPTWQIASVRDMDRDGHPDILWNNVSTGQVLAWFMNGTTMTRQAWINISPLDDTNWRLRGTGDFTGDGHADLVWQHEVTGQPLLWVMQGATVSSAIVLATPGVGAWKIMAVGDANVDGHADLIFENSITGGVVIWAMNRTTPFSGPYVGTVDPTWKISAPR